MKDSARRSAVSWALPLLVLGAGLGITLVGWHLVRVEMQRAEVSRFEHLKERLLFAIKDPLQSVEEALYGARSLVQTSPGLPHTQWAIYAQSVSRFFDRGVAG